MSKLSEYLSQIKRTGPGYRTERGIVYLQLEEAIPKIQKDLAMKRIRKQRWTTLIKQRLEGFEESDISIVTKALSLMKQGYERKVAYEIAVKTETKEVRDRNGEKI